MAKDQLVQESTIDLEEWGRERGVEYYMVNFTDMHGTQRNKLVPIRAISRVQRKGAGFAPFAAGFDAEPSEPDMTVLPDADAAIQIPWQKEIAWVPGNPVMYGEYFMQAPRNVLRKQMAEAAEMGLYFKTGVEPEFSLLSPDGKSLADEFDTEVKPCYHQQAIMRNYHIIREVSDYMHDLGWGCYQNDHEDANGQWEMNWDFDDVLKMADQLSFFKFMIKYVAEKNGMRASFMPKPLPELTGNGLHVHMSAWDAPGAPKNNLFAGSDDTPTGQHGLSEAGKYFLGGIVKHGAASTVICCPTVNSYKRIGLRSTTSGSTWAPNYVTWAGDNRTHLLRLPGDGRMENRLPDGAGNPYLVPAVMMASGLAGIRTKADPGKPLDINMYTQPDLIPEDTPELPQNLLDALRRYEADEVLVKGMGEEFSTAFLNKKNADWRAYSDHLTDWERQRTLDC